MHNEGETTPSLPERKAKGSSEWRGLPTGKHDGVTEGAKKTLQADAGRVEDTGTFRILGYGPAGADHRIEHSANSGFRNPCRSRTISAATRKPARQQQPFVTAIRYNATQMNKPFTIFIVCWILLCVGFVIFYTQASYQAKKSAHPFITVGTGILFLGFAEWLTNAKLPWLFPLAVVVITILNLRNIRFCPRCNATLRGFSRPRFCSKCGTDLP